MKFLVKILSATALFSLTFTACALPEPTAPEQTIPEQPAKFVIAPTTPGIHFIVNGGLTYGGDTIFTAHYTSGNTSDIKAGSLMQIGAGGLYQFEDTPLALMLSANFHMDSAGGRNGEVTFTRFPIEALAYYTGKERFRIGGGMRIVKSPEFKATINGTSETIIYNNATGIVVEVGYQMAPQGWLNFRFVSEKYQANTYTSSLGTFSLSGYAPTNGSHLGVNFTYEF